MRAIAYIRVSTEEQARSGLSLEAQESTIRRYAELYGLDIIAVEIDAGISGKTMDRPALQRTLDSLADGSADAVIISKLDRLTRSVRDLGLLIETYFDQNKSSLHSVGEKIDTSSASGRFMLNILGSVAQWERETISERTRAAMCAKRARGEKTGGRRPFGHNVADDGRTLVRNELEQTAMADMRSLAARGRSLRAIRGVMMEEYGIDVSVSTVGEIVRRNQVAA